MPPKAKANAPSKKNKEKKVAKQAEDKTFGLKNKSGAKQQKFCARVEQQAQHSKNDIRGGAGKPPALTKKQQKEANLAMLDAMLVAPIVAERKVTLSKKQKEADKEKAVVYLTIEELVEVERLKLKQSGKPLTPVTLDSFLIWKKKKRAQKKIDDEKEKKMKEKYAKEGKIMSSTGKELFAYYKETVNMDDDEEADDVDYNMVDSDNEDAENIKKQGGIREITADFFKFEGVDDAINEELFADMDLDDLADELADLEIPDEV
jgi:hypothetical protein